MSASHLKQALYKACQQFIEARITAAQQAIDAARASANNETKSSAGDKHETGRAMAQLEQEKNAHQLAEALKVKQVLDQFDPAVEHDTIQLGSLVKASTGNFYVAIAAGKIELDGQLHFAISPASPIGQQMLGKRAGEQVVVNGRTISIVGVF